MIIYILVTFSISVAAFINLSPEFGTNPSKEQKQLYANYSNYENGEFQNVEEFIMMTEDMPMSEFFRDDSNRIPNNDLIHEKIDLESFISIDENKIKISWLGHSAFILNIDGYILLLDPMLGQYAAPLPLPSLKRYSSNIRFKNYNTGVVDPNVTISMNVPYRKLGYTIYQASYYDEQTTVFAVVKNYGRVFPYVACIIMSIGILFHLFNMVGKRFKGKRDNG